MTTLTAEALIRGRCSLRRIRSGPSPRASPKPCSGRSSRTGVITPRRPSVLRPGDRALRPGEGRTCAHDHAQQPSELLAQLSRFDEARATYAKALNIALRNEFSSPLRFIRTGLAELDFLRGQYARALRAFREIVGGVRFQRLPDRRPVRPALRRRVPRPHGSVRRDGGGDRRAPPRPEADRLQPVARSRRAVRLPRPGHASTPTSSRTSASTCRTRRTGSSARTSPCASWADPAQTRLSSPFSEHLLRPPEGGRRAFWRPGGSKSRVPSVLVNEGRRVVLPWGTEERGGRMDLMFALIEFFCDRSSPIRPRA